MGGSWKAAVSLTPESSATEEEPIDSCREQLVSLRFLCFVDVVDMLPRDLARAVM